MTGLHFHLRNRLVVNVLLILLAIALPLVFLRRLPIPYLWVFLLWSALLGYGAFRSRTSTGRAVFINILVVVVFMLTVELYAYVKSASATLTDLYYSPGYSGYDSRLGFAPAPGTVARSSKTVDGELIYEVQYTIAANGLRFTEGVVAEPGKPCLLFFGGSFTFGEGLEDDQTVPYLTGKALQLAAYNFGFHGYGPHQMLAALELGVVDEVVPCRPVAAVYQAMPAHVHRSAGKASWDKDGPWYQLTDAGVVRAGRFSDSPGLVARRKLLSKAQKSYAYNYFLGNRYWITDEDTRLYAAVVAKAVQSLEARYPGINVQLIWWDNTSEPYAAAVESLLTDIPVSGFHRVSAIIPDLLARPDAYVLPRDGHPNVLANQLIAAYLSQELNEAGNADPGRQSAQE